MALKTDLLEGSSVEVSKDYIRETRIMHVTDLPTVSPSLILNQALASAGVPQLYESHPSGNGSRVIRRKATATSDTSARIEIFYELAIVAPQGAGVVLFTVEDDVVVEMVPSQLMPGVGEHGRKPFRIDFQDPTDATVYHKDTATVNIPMPIRTITLSSQFTSRAQINNLHAVAGKVNGAGWQGLAAGYWLCLGTRSTTFDGGNSWVTQTQLVSKQIEDWSTYTIGRDTQTGKYLNIPASYPARAAALPYRYGINSEFGGLLKIGAYELFDALGAFGI